MNRFEVKIIAAEAIQAEVREEKDKDYSTVRVPKRWKKGTPVTVIASPPDE